MEIGELASNVCLLGHSSWNVSEFNLSEATMWTLLKWLIDKYYYWRAKRIAPTNEELLESVKRFPAPQEWYDENFDDLFED
jgi:hypothetical protein